MAVLAAVALGAGAAGTLVACGEDREGGSVEQIGPGTTGSGATAPTGATTAPETTTGETTTGGTTDDTSTGDSGK